MNVINIIWGFSTGGIGKLFLTYSKLGLCDPQLNITSVCIDLQNCNYDRTPLKESNIRVIKIKNRKDFSWLLKLAKIANEIKPNAIFCHGFNGPIIAKLVALHSKSMRVPMICTYHGLYNPPTKNRKILAGIINRFQAWIYKKYAKKIILVAQYSGEYLISRGVHKEKMVVVYNGISEKKAETPPIELPKDQINIGFAGRLDNIKGLNFLLNAVPLIISNTKEKFHIYIVGDGPEYENLYNQMISLNISEYISFEGYQKNVPAWLDAFDIFCLPSLQENHSIALLEAMRAGKAIVCTDVGGNPETVTHDKEALITPSKDSLSLAKELRKVIEQKELRDQLGENAHKRFQQSFTEEIMKKNLCKVLKSATK